MSRMAFFLSLCAAFICLMSPVVAQDDPNPWPTSTPEAQGMNSEPLTAMLDLIVKHDVNIRSMLVIRNGTLVLLEVIVA